MTPLFLFTKEFGMPFKINADRCRQIEMIIREEFDQTGRVTVRCLDRIHAKTGLAYAAISEIAQKVQHKR